uniref:Anillin, actin binding protein 2 n=1 Tax=Cyprinodon variegatus TaxID=28743 RepID=A0A3Q2D869_CYPVA
MEAAEENGINVTLKRQREPLSDTEDNILPRRRLEAAGEENRSPQPCSSRHLAEFKTKPDTPIIPSVQSRVQLLTQRKDGISLAARRILSDPGTEGPAVPIKGEEEFHQRLERFKAPASQANTPQTQSPASTCSRTRSDFVSNIQQKLQCSTTPSSKQVSIIRQVCPAASGTYQVFRETEEEQISELFTFDGDETVEGSTCGEEEIEPSTDEELRVWRYPQQEVCVDEDAVLEKKQVFNKKDEPELSREGKENIDGAPDLDNKRLDEEKSEGEDEVDDSLKKRPASKAETLEEKPSTSDLEINSGIVAQPSVKNQTNEKDGAQGSSEIQMSVSYEEGKESTKGRKDVVDELTVHKAERSKKVTFILEPELINRSVSSESDVSEELVEEDGEGHDSGISACSGEKGGVEKSRREEEPKEEESDENDGDELLTFPKGGILSPLSKSVEAVVTPLVRTLLSPCFPFPNQSVSDGSAWVFLFVDLLCFDSIDAYRTQRQNKLPTIQSVTPAVQRRTPETPNPEAPVVTKERITDLNEEAGKLQTVINQTLQALSCCTDEEHGRGSLEEAEAEKLLLVSCEKRSALLAEVVRLREERNLQSGELPKDTDYVSQQPCRGTVTITNIQLPLKVEYVCSSHSRAGRPSHYFFILIRYGPCNIIATPLATAADARNGDTISFPTAVKLQDIRSSFEIDVEVYSLCNIFKVCCQTQVTPRKLLNTITVSAAPSALNTRRSSNFSLVGSHKITLASLGCSKFPLDKMKLDGKIRKLLGDEFQEKVPFLSPLEGHIYLKLESKGHSDVRHQGFLTMFELISGFGVWNRRYFVLEECNMYWWNNPNDRETKEAEGSIFLSRSPNQCVRPVKRDSCARPFTFELVNTSQQDDQKCWFSADTKQERLDWMEKLNQALLDFHTWNSPERVNEAGRVRESIL